ncbi:MAG: hypothetical protein NC936_06125 [Candidatus Omnitrophica bacterium]|nr:hypothetical protein [Candidatus Omnitrophota bacterium]
MKYTRIVLSINIALLLFINISFCPLSAQEIDEDIQETNRLEQICEQLQNKKLTNKEKAELLYEKSYLMLTTFWVTSLRTGTESLLEAIKLDPQNKKYYNFLCQVYDNLLRDRDFNDEDEFAKDFQSLKEKVRIEVEEYRKIGK